MKGANNEMPLRRLNKSFEASTAVISCTPSNPTHAPLSRGIIHTQSSTAASMSELMKLCNRAGNELPLIQPRTGMQERQLKAH